MKKFQMNEHPLAKIQAAQKNTQGLAKLPQLKIDAKVMLPVNIEIYDNLINS